MERPTMTALLKAEEETTRNQLRADDAVDRNRAKRLMREAFRLLAKDGRVPGHTEWVFVARRAIAGKKVQDVVQDIAAFCEGVPGDA